MFCKYCGTEITDSTRPCPKCGNYQGAGVDGMDHSAQKQPNYQQPNYQQPNYQQPNYQQPNYQQPNYQQPNYQQPNYQQPNYQQPNYQQPNYQQSNYQQPPYPVQPQTMYPYPMKWYKALIYVLLFLTALSGLVNGIMFFSGSHYQGYGDMVYAMIPGLKGLDSFVGILSLALIPVAIITRQKLAGFKRDSLNWLMITYVLGAATSLIYTFGAIAIVGDLLPVEELISTQVVSLIASVVVIVLNNIYFKKRASLFIN